MYILIHVFCMTTHSHSICIFMEVTADSITANTIISIQLAYTRVFVQPTESPLGPRGCWQHSRYVILVYLSVYVYIQTVKSELSGRKNTAYTVCLLGDFLSHYEFFIVVAASKASVLCSVLSYLSLSSVTKL